MEGCVTKSFAAFSKKFPDVKLDVITDNVKELQNLLLSGEIDICIEATDFDTELFYTEDLATEHYYLAVSKENPFNETHKEQQLKTSDIVSDSSALYNNKEISLSDCLNESFIVLDTKNNDPDITVDLFQHMKQIPQINLRCYNIETMFHWVNSNLGMGIIPDTLIRFGNFENHPIYYKIKEPKGCFGITEKKIVVAYSKKHFLTQTAPIYIDLLKQLIGQGTWKF